MTALYGIAVWLILAPAIGWLIYVITKIMIEKLVSLKNTQQQPIAS